MVHALSGLSQLLDIKNRVFQAIFLPRFAYYALIDCKSPYDATCSNRSPLILRLRLLLNNFFDEFEVGADLRQKTLINLAIRLIRLIMLIGLINLPIIILRGKVGTRNK